MNALLELAVAASRRSGSLATFDVAMPHPRNMASAEVASLKAAVLREFGL
jgi:hypothetical protein